MHAKLLRTMTHHKVRVLIKISHDNYIRNTFGFARTQFWTMNENRSYLSRCVCVWVQTEQCYECFHVTSICIKCMQIKRKKICLCCTVMRWERGTSSVFKLHVISRIWWGDSIWHAKKYHSNSFFTHSTNTRRAWDKHELMLFLFVPS